MKLRLIAFLPLALVLSVPQVSRCVDDFDDAYFPDADELPVVVEPEKTVEKAAKVEMPEIEAAESAEMPAAVEPERTVTKAVEPKQVAEVKEEGTVKELSTRDELVNALKNNKFIAVKVYAEWCGACKMAKPAFEEAAKEYKELKAFEINADKADLREFVDAFGITGLPTVIYLRIEEGQKKDKKFEDALKDFKKLPAAVAHKEKSGVSMKPADTFKADMRNWLEAGESKALVAVPAKEVAAPKAEKVEVKHARKAVVEKPAKRERVAKKPAKKHARNHRHVEHLEQVEEVCD